MRKSLPNVHPGEVLLEEFLKPMDISQNALARAIGASEQFWMGLQADYDLEEARKTAAGDLRKVRPLAA